MDCTIRLNPSARMVRSVVFIASDGHCAGLIAVADHIKVSSFEAIQQLKREGLHLIMVTGDNRTTAAAVAGKLGIDFESDVSPSQKADVIKKLQAQGKIVAMAGDGINDAARAGTVERRHSDGHRNGCSDSCWRNHPRQRGSSRHRAG